MGIYIGGIEMPKTESEVLIIAIKSDGSVYPVRIDGDGQPMIFPNEEMKNCAVPVPPHGRLGDLDELAKIVLNWIATQEKAYPNEDSNTRSWRFGARGMGRQIYRDIKAAPIIIPASEEGKI